MFNDGWLFPLPESSDPLLLYMDHCLISHSNVSKIDVYYLWEIMEGSIRHLLKIIDDSLALLQMNCKIQQCLGS